ncbi:trithorax group protein osa isoform X2 [Hyalella azteca]|uniref:SUZ RNA-binding domain-containing n=1 Tax=Hyalella azteca TaxID=294128 RepID=A0A8B7N1P1_HYAAZ|nr:trithorax group protein osa isoform X2 [Hyalella azteca]
MLKMEESNRKTAPPAESWEEIAENPECLEKQLSKIKIKNCSSSPNNDDVPQQSLNKQVTILSGDEHCRTQYVPEVKVLIMKRPSQSSSDAAAAKPKAPLKTLEQRQAEYNEARIRILGNAEPTACSDKTDASSVAAPGDVSKGNSPVAQGAQRGLITGAAARQQQQSKPSGQWQNKHKTSGNSQNKRANNASNNNQSNNIQYKDQSHIVQQQTPITVPTREPGLTMYSVPEFYPGDSQAIHHYQQPYTHCYPPTMTTCQPQYPTSMAGQQPTPPQLPQPYSAQDYSLSAQPYPPSSYGPGVPAPAYMPSPNPVYSPYVTNHQQLPFHCYAPHPFPLPPHQHPQMMSLQQQPPLQTQASTPVSYNLQQLPPQTLSALADPQQPMPAQPPHQRQQNKKQNKRNQKNTSNLRPDNSTSPTLVNGKKSSPKIMANGAASGEALKPLSDSPANTSSPPPDVSLDAAEASPMETVNKQKKKRKKKKNPVKTSATSSISTTGKTNGTLSSKEGNGRIIRMPRGPDGTKGFTLVR